MQFLALTFSVESEVNPETIDLYVDGALIETVSIEDVLQSDGSFSIKGWYDITGASIGDIGIFVSGSEGGSVQLTRVRLDDTVRRDAKGVTLDAGSGYVLNENLNTRWGFGATETDAFSSSATLFNDTTLTLSAEASEPAGATEAAPDTSVVVTFSNPSGTLVDRVEVLLDGAVIAASDVAGVYGARKTFALEAWVAAGVIALSQLTVHVTGADGATLEMGRIEIEGASITAQGKIQLVAGNVYSFDTHGRQGDRFVIAEETPIPASEAPVEEPAAQEPADGAPVVEEPTTEEPAAQEPATEEPAVEEPVAEEPAAQEPVAEQPAVEEPVAEEPAAQEPAAEEPAVEEPVAEEPAAQEPVAEEPAAEEVGLYAGQLTAGGGAFSLVLDPSGTPPEGAAIRIEGLPDGATIQGGVQDQEGRWMLGLDAAGTVLGRLGSGFAGALVLSAAMVSASGQVLAHSGPVYTDVEEAADYQGVIADGAAVGFSAADLQSIALGLSLSSEALQGRLVIEGLPAGARVVGGTQQTDGSWAVDFARLPDLALVFDGAPAEGTVLRLVAEVAANSATPVSPTVQSLVLTQDPVMLAALGDAAVEVLEGSVHQAPAVEEPVDTATPDSGTPDPVVSDGTSSPDGGTSGGSEPIQVAMAAPLLEGQQSGVIYAPEVIEAQAPGEIVGLKLQVGTLGEGASKVATFGHVFAEGDLRPGDTIVARIGGQELALQVNAKATHPDGSVRHAILSVELPEWASGQTLDVMLAKAQPAALPPALDASDILASGLDMQVRMDFSDGTSATVDVAQLLSDAIANGTVKTWMEGPLATEVRLAADVREDFQLSFDVRML
ncbi:MAG: hypothetical protein LPL00_04585, partial [Alphaproteobacteria bacterium]|nr:hypothetical protein [Alphaproteobacteria bacterium]MDX5368780.1 hypothetical protein [Alphaproteobacteria bacterium]MDX5463516.1 hypothetical protein [Alphaproteobacteria bacterium]